MSTEIDIDIEHGDMYMQNISALIRATQNAMNEMRKQVIALAGAWPDQGGNKYCQELNRSINDYQKLIDRLNKLHKFVKDHTDKAKSIRDAMNV